MLATTTQVAAEIRRANDTFETSFARGDAAAIAGLYTPNALLLPTGMESIEGTAGIQAFWAGAIATGLTQVTLHTQDVEELADTAIEIGHYILSGPDLRTVD